jgi:hypothetical protein
MRNYLKRGFVLSAIAGTCLYAIAPAALAQPTTSPEAFGVEASGSLLGTNVTVGPIPDQTSVGTTGTPLNVTVPGVLNLVGLFATVNSVNSSEAGVASLNNTGIAALLGTFSAGAITETCAATAGGISGSAAIANLNLLGITENGTLTTPGTPVVVGGGLLSLLGLASATVTLNEEDPGPVSVPGSETFYAIHVQLTTAPLVGTAQTLNLYVASATCGPYNSSMGTPVAGGKGLGIGLGLLGLFGAGTAAVYVRRRKGLIAAA